MLINLKKCHLCLVGLSFVMVFFSCENTKDSNKTKQLVVNDAVLEDSSVDLNVEKKKVKPTATIVLTIGDWEPYTSSRSKNANITEIVVKEAFALENINVEYEYFAWEKSMDNVKKGISLGTFPWLKTEEREEEYYLSKEPIFFDKTVFFHLRDLSFDWKNYSDLKNYKIGGTVGYSDLDILEKEGLIIDKVKNEDLNYKKLLTKEIDIYPNSFLVGFYHVNMFFDKATSSLLTTHSKPLMYSHYYILFSKKNPQGKEISEIFDRGIGKLKNSGRYDEIYEDTMLKLRALREAD